MSDNEHDIASYDIAIVGGGMVGASLALMFDRALNRSGQALQIALLEARPFESQEPSQVQAADNSLDLRSTALAPTTVAAMQSLGAWQAMQPYATAIKQIQVTDKGHFGRAVFTEKDNQGRPLGHVVENRGLALALIKAVQQNPNIEVRAPAKVTKLQPRANRVTLNCYGASEESTSIQTRLLIVADGADSPLRAQLGMSASVTDYQQTAIVANIETEQAHCATAYERFTIDGPLALLPLDSERGRRCGVVWTQPQDKAKQTLALEDDAFLQALQQAFGQRLGRLVRVGQRAHYPLSLRVAKEQVRSNVVLMGNAAHFLHPVAGQGFNLAVRDALRLIDILQNEKSEDIGRLKVLQRYEQAQLRDQDRTITLSHSFNQTFRHPSKFVALMRNVGLSAIEHQPLIRELFLTQLSGQAERQARLL